MHTCPPLDCRVSTSSAIQLLDKYLEPGTIRPQQKENRPVLDPYQDLSDCRIFVRIDTISSSTGCPRSVKRSSFEHSALGADAHRHALHCRQLAIVHPLHGTLPNRRCSGGPAGNTQKRKKSRTCWIAPQLLEAVADIPSFFRQQPALYQATGLNLNWLLPRVGCEGVT